MDRKWWNEYATELRAFEGELWTTNAEAARIYRLHHIRAEVGAGMPKEPGTIMLGSHSGYQAVQLAIHFGAARVVLLGYDLQAKTKQRHWHGNHRNLGNPVPDRFPEWRREFHKLKREMLGVEIVNATRDTALECFDRVPLEEALA